jgi:hypothetical protein
MDICFKQARHLASRTSIYSALAIEMKAYLVSISPEEVLGADVLEGVLDALLERGHVRDVLPVLGPQTPGVDAGDAEGRNHNAVREKPWLDGC